MLRNQKHEAFCQLTLQGTKYGWSQADIYQKAGYRARGHSAEVLGSNLLKNVEIQARIAELSQPAIKKAGITAETLLDKLEANIVGAEAKGQHGAVNGSVALMAQLRGLLINRTEISEVGPFDRCATIPDLVRQLLTEEPAAEALQTLDVLRREIERQAADGAVVIAEPARPQVPGRETALALSALRPRYRRR